MCRQKINIQRCLLCFNTPLERYPKSKYWFFFFGSYLFFCLVSLSLNSKVSCMNRCIIKYFHVHLSIWFCRSISLFTHFSLRKKKLEKKVKKEKRKKRKKVVPLMAFLFCCLFVNWRI